MTFGYELEFFGANLWNLSELYDIPWYSKGHRCDYHEFHFSEEIDITDILSSEGGELISPIYTEKTKQKCLQELREKLKILKKEGAYLKENANDTGFHIHLGRQVLESRAKKALLLKFLFAFQPEIFDFARGKDAKIRDNVVINAREILRKDINLELDHYPEEKLFSGKHKCIRFTPFSFELRYFNSSLDYEVLESYLEFAWHLYAGLQKNTWDLEKIEYYNQQYYIIGKSPNKERREAMFQILKLKRND